MNIIQSLLCQTLHTPESQLRSLLQTRMSLCPLGWTETELDALLKGRPGLNDTLWKFSVGLNVPHQWLFDAYRLQQDLSQLP